MKLFIIFLSLSISFPSLVKCQHSIELKAGINLPSINNLSNEFSEEFYHEETFSPGLYVSANAESNPLNNFLIGAGIEFSYVRMSDTSRYYYSTYKSYKVTRIINVTNSFYFLQIPLFLKYTFKEKISLAIGLAPTLVVSSHAKGQIIDSNNPFQSINPDINEPIKGLNPITLNAKTSISYAVNRNLGIEFSFQLGLNNIFEEGNFYENGYYPNYASSYKGGNLNIYNIGIMYILSKNNSSKSLL